MLLTFAVLVPFVGIVELGRAIGEGKLEKLFLKSTPVKRDLTTRCAVERRRTCQFVDICRRGTELEVSKVKELTSPMSGA
jgi:hypothetical protein